MEYPALPEVDGTRINSGKKTSFIDPEEFPTFSDNDYREAMATTPGIVVSEEPSSPIINLGYRGLDSQRSEFMQMLKDGVSIKNEQFGFPGNALHPDPRCRGDGGIHSRRRRPAVRPATGRRDQLRHPDAAP